MSSKDAEILWSFGPISRVQGYITNGYFVCGVRFNDVGIFLGCIVGGLPMVGALFILLNFNDDHSRRERLIDGHCEQTTPVAEYWSTDDSSGYHLRWTRHWTVDGERFSGNGMATGHYGNEVEAKAAQSGAVPPEAPCLVDPEEPTWVTEELDPPQWQLTLALAMMLGGAILWLGIAHGDGPTSVTIS